MRRRELGTERPNRNFDPLLSPIGFKPVLSWVAVKRRWFSVSFAAYTPVRPSRKS